RFEITYNHGEEVVKIMSHPSCQLAYAFHLLRLLETLFSGLALGQVPSHLGKANYLTVAIVNGVDNNACPKQGAVFADAPSFHFMFPGTSRRFERPLRNTIRLVLFCIEAREVLSNDLLSLVPLDPFGSRIPVDDHPVGVEHENGIVGDTFHQNAETAFCFL